MGKIRITLFRSLIGRKPRQRGTARALGLKKIGRVVELEATPQILGMANSIRHMVKTEEID